MPEIPDPPFLSTICRPVAEICSAGPPVTSPPTRMEPYSGERRDPWLQTIPS